MLEQYKNWLETCRVMYGLPKLPLIEIKDMQPTWAGKVSGIYYHGHGYVVVQSGFSYEKTCQILAHEIWHYRQEHLGDDLYTWMLEDEHAKNKAYEYAGYAAGNYTKELHAEWAAYSMMHKFFPHTIPTKKETKTMKLNLKTFANNVLIPTALIVGFVWGFSEYRKEPMFTSPKAVAAMQQMDQDTAKLVRKFGF